MSDIASRLRLARESAGFESARDAAARFGWRYPTYSSHENGSRGVRTEMLSVYAQAFRVDQAWLLSGGGKMSAPDGSPRQVAHRSAGFGESDVMPFVAASASAAKIVETLAASLAAGARHVQTYVAQRDYAAFAIQRGDLLIMGTPRNPADGDLVIATLTNPESAAAFTVLRQRFGDSIVPPIYGRIPQEDRMEAGILGTIISVVRNPGFA